MIVIISLARAETAGGSASAASAAATAAAACAGTPGEFQSKLL